MITPETFDAVEYVPFSVGFSIEPADPEIPVEIESVSVTASDGEDYSAELTIDITSSSAFTVSGTLADVFGRTLSYLDKNDVSGTVSKFKDIPTDFNTLYKYVGAVVNSVDLTVTVVTTEGIETATIVVRNNWEIANAKLSEYVAKGNY